MTALAPNLPQNANQDRAWMLVVMESDQIYDNTPSNIANGGWCVGFQINPETKQPFTTFLPCIVGAGNKRASPGSTAVAWNPNGLWLAQDVAAQNKESFVLTSIDGQYSLQAPYQFGGAANSFNTDFGIHHVSVGLQITQYDAGKNQWNNGPPTNFTADTVTLNEYIYVNVNQIDLLDATNGHLGAVTPNPSSIYEQAAQQGDAFDVSKLPGGQVFTFQGMQGGQLLNGMPWVQIRSVPYYANASTTLGQADNACAYENPENVAATPKDRPSTLFCCGSGANAQYTVLKANFPFQNVTIATCQNMTFEHYLQMLQSPPHRIYPSMGTLTACPPGKYGPDCLQTCPGSYTAYNCGCLRGLTAHSDGSCRLLSPSVCTGQAGMQGISLLTGQCACPPGFFGTNCGQQLGGNPIVGTLQKYLKPLLLAGGVFGVIAILWLLFAPSTPSKKVVVVEKNISSRTAGTSSGAGISPRHNSSFPSSFSSSSSSPS